MQEWQIARRKGRSKQEVPRHIDPRLTSFSSGHLPTDSSGQPVPLTQHVAAGAQQAIQSIGGYRQTLKNSQLFKAVQSAFQIAKADSLSEEDDSGSQQAWRPHKLQTFVIWGLGSFTAGGSVLHSVLWNKADIAAVCTSLDVSFRLLS